MKRLINKIQLKVLKAFGYKVVHFIHIGKTGGSAIKNAFAESAGIHKKQLKSKPYLFRMNEHSFKMQDVMPDELVFFVVRDPVSRFVSSFYSRQREGRPKNYNPWSPDEKVAFELFATPNSLAEGLSSNDSTIKDSAVKAMNSIHHVKRHYWEWFKDEEFLRTNASRILLVMRQERLTEDFNSFRSKYNLKLSSLPTDPVKRHKNPDSVDKKLSETAIKNLKEWYETDYKFIEILKDLKLLEG